jgi:1-acyl-sn-glycerol-3-phosphate acyltransferase
VVGPVGKSAVRDALRWIFRRIAKIYFRDIEVAGHVPAPATGGRLFAANHVNALVDPILVLTQAPCDISPVAKSTLWKIPGLKWLLDVADAVPIVRRKDTPDKKAEDNEAVFARVATHLAGGGNILIFPEGTSHNEPHLLTFRSGAGRMLARAAKEKNTDLTFQAVALEFDARDIFRSRSLVLFGPVRGVRGLEGDDLARRVTEVLKEDLSELLVEGETWEDRILVVRVAQMFAQEKPTLEEVNRFGRRIELVRNALKQASPELVASLESRLRAYFAKLDAEEVTDDIVARGGSFDIDAGRVLRAAAMIATFPLAVLASIFYFVPYQLPRLVTRLLRGDPDVASTYKLGVGLAVYPLWAGVAIALLFWKLPAASAALLSLLVLAGPFAALPWLDRWDRMRTRLSLTAAWSFRRDRLRALAKEREILLRDLTDASERAPSA